MSIRCVTVAARFYQQAICLLKTSKENRSSRMKSECFPPIGLDSNTSQLFIPLKGDIDEFTHLEHCPRTSLKSPQSS
jgi:hypothetical protein